MAGARLVASEEAFAHDELKARTFAGAPYVMPKFSAILPTPDTRGDFEEMALAAGDGAGRVTDILAAGEIVRRLAR